jgi:hypothetical protein
MINIEQNWKIINPKKERKQFTKRNKEVVTLRLSPVENKYYLKISIGLNIAERLGFSRDQNVTVYQSPTHERLLGIALNPNGRYKLRGSDLGSFLFVIFLFEEPKGMKLSSTVVTKYAIGQDMNLGGKSITVDLGV